MARPAVHAELGVELVTTQNDVDRSVAAIERLRPGDAVVRTAGRSGRG